MKRRMMVGLGFASAVLFAAACSTSTNSSTATSPSPVLSTDTFNGTISPLGSTSNIFTVNYAASYSNASVTVTSLTTASGAVPQSITIGVGFGSTNLGVCTRSTSFTNAAAPLNTELNTNGTPFIAGTYCVQIFDNPDAPTVTEPLNYTITVKHY